MKGTTEELSEVWSYQSDPPSRRKNIPRIFSFLKTLLKKRKDVILNVAMHQKLVHISLSIKTHEITNSRCLSLMCILQNAMDYLLPCTVSKSNTASTTKLELTLYTLVRMTHSLGQTLLCHLTKRVWCVGEISLIV